MSFLRFPSDLRSAFSEGKFGTLAQSVSAAGALREATALVKASGSGACTPVKRAQPSQGVAAQYSTPPSAATNAATRAIFICRPY